MKKAGPYNTVVSRVAYNVLPVLNIDLSLDPTIDMIPKMMAKQRLRQLATREVPVWGRHTVATCQSPEGSVGRVIVLQGDQPGDTFEEEVFIDSTMSSFGALSSAYGYLYTTERPVAGKAGAAQFPRTLRVVREVMGKDALIVLSVEVGLRASQIDSLTD
mmetsp:Transcript_45820/g.113888  ORF Transcript_45820/g.113888 Transcript_45820/m.113888 type:complete len:160 (+) Transcript_45820:359-838(+)